jgi:hypothetical protein
MRKIVALSEIYSEEDVSAAMDESFVFEAFSSEYIANILERRKWHEKGKTALSLTRNQDLLDLEIEKPNLGIYDKKEK